MKTQRACSMNVSMLSAKLACMHETHVLQCCYCMLAAGQHKCNRSLGQLLWLQCDLADLVRASTSLHVYNGNCI